MGISPKQWSISRCQPFGQPLCGTVRLLGCKSRHFGDGIIWLCWVSEHLDSACFCGELCLELQILLLASQKAWPSMDSLLSPPPLLLLL
ncbi:hypothetical protein BVC80_7613g5 [Macleaya cordata]|uniref:Uncharacterized protein n=1 Tax=Macleaya cordata TaxID=56857 RepID=A0A200QI46_MACCD|nr:hypothetical protein BVC80_7613g5 [Macleaya cordata]